MLNFRNNHSSLHNFQCNGASMHKLLCNGASLHYFLCNEGGCQGVGGLLLYMQDELAFLKGAGK